MANDFGFRDLSWFKFAGQKCFDILYPLRSKEIQLDREIRHLLGQVDVKQAELKNLHVRALLEARRAGLSKKDIEDAVSMEKEDRRKAISIPPSQAYMPGRELSEDKKFGSNVRSTKPFGGEEKRDSWHPDAPPHSKDDLDSIVKDALEQVEGSSSSKKSTSFTDPTPRLGLHKREGFTSPKKSAPSSLEDYMPEIEWGHDATPTPKHGIPVVKEEDLEKPGLLARLISPVKKNGIFPRMTKEHVIKKKDDNR